MGSIETASELTWQGSNISFWLITLMVIVSAVFAAFSRNIVRAAYSLFFTLFGVAGYYVLLGSGFLAITQIIIYVGGILVLLMFGVLLTDRPLKSVEQLTLKRFVISGFVGVLMFGVVLGHIIWNTKWPTVTKLQAPMTSVRALGEALLDRHILSFEVAGAILLLCLLGAAYLVRRQER